MLEQAGANRLRYLVPFPFLAGIAVAFAGCCLAGWVAGQFNIYRHFARFHTHISPFSHYYPTACQVRALGRSRLDPERIAVVVGGNSILFGHNVSDLWTRHLQAELGNRFVVLNFAMPSALPAEFGEVAAEMLQREHPKLLFVTLCGSSTFPDNPDGHFHRYFFWDAYYKGLIPHDALRDAWLANAAKQRATQGEAFAEMKRGARLDAALRFQDLWTTITYKRLSTVWTPATARQFTRARRKYVEQHEPEPPVEQRYRPAAHEHAMWVLRYLIKHGAAVVREQTPEGCALAYLIHRSFPEECRRRTLMLVARDSPYYIAQLSPTEQLAYDSVFPGLVGALESDGMPALEVGKGYSAADYWDRCHFSDQGGRRLAADVAPKLRDMARNLGYLE
jgi:hypothetical protein